MLMIHCVSEDRPEITNARFFFLKGTFSLKWNAKPFGVLLFTKKLKNMHLVSIPKSSQETEHYNDTQEQNDHTRNSLKNISMSN